MIAIVEEHAMNRNEIESQIGSTIEKDLKDLLSESPVGKKQLIDINGEASPAVLAGLLGINVSLVYQYRQDGKLPPNSDASYRDCILHHTKYLKKVVSGKASSSAEAAVIQKIKLDTAKTEQTWLDIRQKRKELVDIKALVLAFEPYFVQMQSQLSTLARKHPECQQEIDRMLGTWNELGKRLEAENDQRLTDFVDAKLAEEVVAQVEEEILPESEDE